MAAALFFLYGLAAGFLLVRLRRARPVSPTLKAVAWVTMSASFALAALLLAWGFWPR